MEAPRAGVTVKPDWDICHAREFPHDGPWLVKSGDVDHAAISWDDAWNHHVIWAVSRHQSKILCRDAFCHELEELLRLERRMVDMIDDYRSNLNDMPVWRLRRRARLRASLADVEASFEEQRRRRIGKENDRLRTTYEGGS